jgi:parallel beta-helix repeat protein
MKLEKSMRKPIAIALLVVAAAGTRLAAEEGRIPIFAQTIISRPGYYILTRDIAASNGVVVIINTDGATLDLNGHTITSLSTFNSVVEVYPSVRNATVRNGRVSGGFVGLSYTSGGQVHARIRLEDLDVTDPISDGVYAYGVEDMEVRSCHITGNSAQTGGVEVYGGPISFSGRFVNNTIETHGQFGMYLYGLLGGEVRGNRISYVTGVTGAGLDLSGTAGAPHGANLIESNVIIGGVFAGIRLCADCDANVIVNNVIAGNGSGILASSGGNRIAENTVAGNGGGGILVAGSRNLIEGNQVKDNTGCGISFTGSGTENAYRNNMVRGNGTAVCGSATDGGGNIVP